MLKKLTKKQAKLYEESVERICKRHALNRDEIGSLYLQVQYVVPFVKAATEAGIPIYNIINIDDLGK